MSNSDPIDRLRKKIEDEGALALGDDRPAWIPGDDTSALADRVVSAGDLQQLLVERGGSQPFNVLGALIVGPLTLDYISLTFPLAFVECTFDSPITAVQARFPSLLVRDCEIHGDEDLVSLGCDRLVLDGNLELSGTVAYGPVRIPGAKVGGQFIFPNLRIRGKDSDDVSLFAAGAEISDSVWAGEGLECGGRVDLSRIQVAGDMHLSNATINTDRSDAWALNAYGMDIAGTVYADGINSYGELVFGGTISGDLRLLGVTIESSEASLEGRDLQVRGSTYLFQCAFSGPIRLGRCDFSKDLILAEGTVGLSDGDVSVDLAASRVGGTLRVSNGWRGGTIDLSEARIGQSLVMTDVSVGATADRGGEQARSSLLAHRVFVEGDVNVGGSDFAGHLMFMGSRIGGSLFFSHCKVLGVNATGASVICDRAEVGGSFRVEATALSGALRTPSMRVGSQYRIDLEVETPDSDSCVVVAHGASVAGRGRMFVRCSADSSSADVGGSRWARGLHMSISQSIDETSSLPHLRAESADPTDLGLVPIDPSTPHPTAMKVFGALAKVDAGEIEVTGEAIFALVLDFPDAWSAVAFECDPFDVSLTNSYVTGSLAVAGFPVTMDLSGCSIGTLVLPDNTELLPALRAAEGWKLGALAGSIASDRKTMSRWLRRYYHSGQTWYEVATIFEQRGALEDGRRLRYEAARQRSREAPFPRRVASLAGRAITGYGYYPLRSLAALALVCVVAAVLCAVESDQFETPATSAIISTEFESASPNHGGMVSAEDCSMSWDVACFDPVAFALESMVPGSTGNQSHWQPSESWITYALAALRIAAWILTALFLAGVTGLLRKKE